MPDKLQPVYTPFNAGIDQQAHPYQVRSPYLRHAINVDFRRDIGPQKREGLHALPTDILGGGQITNGGQVLQCGDELLCCDDQAVYSWSPKANRWVARGELRPTIASTRPTAVSGAAVKQSWGASIPSLGLEAVVWLDANGMHASVQDVQTGTRVIDDVVIATQRSQARVVATSSTFCVFSADTNGNIYSAQLLPSQNGIGQETVIVVGQTTGFPLFDVAYDATSDGYILAYMFAGGQQYGLLGLRNIGTAYPQPYRASMDMFGVGGSFGPWSPPSKMTQATCITVTVTATGTGDAARNIVVTRGYLVPGSTMQAPQGGGYIADWRQGTINFPTQSYSSIGVSPSGGSPSNPVANVCGTYNAATGTIQILVSASIYDATFIGGPTSYQLLIATFTAPGGAAVTTYTLGGAALMSRPFTLASGRSVAWLMSFTTLSPLTGANAGGTPQLNTPTAYLYDLTSRTFQARVAAGVVDPNTMSFGATAGSVQAPFVRGSSMAISALLVTRLVSGLGVASTATLVPQSGAYDLIVQSTTGSALQAAVLDNAALFAGGMTLFYDGASVVESGFFAPPDLYAIGAAANGNMAVGTYQYQAIWEWYDARGRRHRSAPSRTITVTVSSAGASVNLRVATLQLTRRRNVALTIYRTQANLPVFYQVTDSTNPILNNQAVNFLYPVDTLADASIGGNEAIYTGGGELPNDPPPASTLMLRARTRIMVAGGEYADTITYSKQNDIGTGIQWSLGLQKRVTAVPGSIVAMAALDDKVIVFKSQGICYFQGTGVTAAGVAAGNNDDFSDPVILSTDLWCVAPNSVTTTADGVYFMSQKGMYLIDHSLGFYAIGAAVTSYNAQNVTSTVSHPALQQVRVACREDTALIYHPRKVQPFGDFVAQAGAWTTYSNFASVSACVWNGQYVLLRANGRVCVQSATYDDDGVQVVQSIRTAWLTGTQALQAARFGALVVIGDLTDPSRMNIDMAISYESTPVARLTYDAKLSSTPSAWGGDATWGASASWGGDATSAYIFRVRELPEQVMGASAVQFTFSDAPPAGSQSLQRGSSLHGYAILVEPMAGIPSLPDKQSL